MNEAKPGDLRTGQGADQPPGRMVKPVVAHLPSIADDACGVYPDAQARGKLQGALLELLKVQTLEF